MLAELGAATGSPAQQCQWPLRKEPGKHPGFCSDGLLQSSHTLPLSEFHEFFIVRFFPVLLCLLL